jgi:hypothetical protein
MVFSSFKQLIECHFSCFSPFAVDFIVKLPKWSTCIKETDDYDKLDMLI